MTRLSAILSLLSILLVGCGMSEEERQNIAAVSCSIILETRNMDGALRVREVNATREKLGEPPYLGGDDGIIEAVESGLCLSLVLNSYDDDYEELQRLISEKKEKERAEQEQEERRIEDERQQTISTNTPKWEEFVDSTLTGNGRRDFTFECFFLFDNNNNLVSTTKSRSVEVDLATNEIRIVRDNLDRTVDVVGDAELMSDDFSDSIYLTFNGRNDERPNLDTVEFSFSTTSGIASIEVGNSSNRLSISSCYITD